MEQHKTDFFEVTTFNNDIIPSHDKHLYLATVYWRIDVNEVFHERQVFVFKDWLGSIAGI